MFLVGHAVVVAPPTGGEDLLDLVIVEDDGEGDGLEFLEVEGTSAGGDVDVAAASKYPAGHVKDGPHGAPEGVDFVFPSLAGF